MPATVLHALRRTVDRLKAEEQQRQKDEALRKQAELDKKKKEAAEQQKRAVAEAAAAEKRREDQLKRLAGIAGAIPWPTKRIEPSGCRPPPAAPGWRSSNPASKTNNQKRPQPN